MHTLRHTNTAMFVTVLTACLGLLTVGGHSHAYGQQVAVTATGEFKCSDSVAPEIEGLLSHDVFIRPLADFFADIKRLISIGKLNPNDTFQLRLEDINTESGITTRSLNNSGNAWVSTAASGALDSLKVDLIRDVNNVEFYRYDAEHNQNISRTILTFEANESDFIVHFSFEQKSPEEASKLAALYNSYFAEGVCRFRGEPEGIIYQNAKALTDKDQVLIVIHLPRAALIDKTSRRWTAN